MFIPIYLNGAPTGSVAERRENFTGLGLGVFRIGDLADAAAAKFSNSPIPVDIEIFDLSAPVETSRLYPKSAASVGEDQGSSNFLGTRKLTVGGREWSVVTVPTAAFLAESRSAWWPYTVLLAGLLFTGLTAQLFKTGGRSHPRDPKPCRGTNRQTDPGERRAGSHQRRARQLRPIRFRTIFARRCAA